MILVLLPPSEHCIRVQSVALCQATTLLTYMYVPSAGEVARYKAKVLVTDNTLLEDSSVNTTLLAGLPIVLVNVLTTVHTAACRVSNQTTPYLSYIICSVCD